MMDDYGRNCDWAIKRFNLDPQSSIYVLVNTLADAVRKSDECQNNKGEVDGKRGKGRRVCN